MAGNTEKIDEIVDRSAVSAQITQTTAELNEMEKQLLDALRGANQLNQALGRSQTFRQYNQSAEQAARATANLQAAQNRAAITANNLQQSNIRLQQAQHRQTQQAERQAQVAARQSSEYQKLVASFNAATAAAREAGVVYGTSSAQFTTATARVRELRGQLDAIDQPLGNFQRNVGNYSSAIVNFGQRAFGAVRTIANILPGLGLSGAFLLIFEGLKYAADQLGIFATKSGQAEANLKALVEVQKNASKEYGDQATKLQILYKAATDVNNKEEDRIAAARELQKLFPQTFKNSTIQAILNGNESESYQQLTKDLLDNAKARAAQEKLADLAEKRQDIAFQKEKINNARRAELGRVTGTTTAFGVGTGGGAGQATDVKLQRTNINVRADLALKEQSQQDKILEGQQKFILAYAGGNNRIAKAITDGDKSLFNTPKTEDKSFDDRLRREKELEEAVLNSETSSYQERLDAINRYEKNSDQIIKEGVRAKVYRIQEGANKSLEIDNETAKQRAKVQADANKELAKLLSDGEKQQNAELQNDIISLRESQDTRLLEIEKYQSDALSAYADLYSQGKISAAQYNQSVYDIEKQSAKDRIDLQIQTLEKILAVQQANLEFGIGDPKDIQRTQNLITKLRIDSSNLATQVELDNIRKVEQARQKLYDLEKQAGDQTITLIQTLVDGGYQRQLEALDEQKQKIQDNANSEKEAVDNSLLSAQQKADRNKVIDAQAAAANEQIAQRERKIKSDQAKFDRLASIARVIQATSLAEVQALTYLANPFTAPLYPGIAAAIGALGALQLATILATPLPKFAKGTTNSPEGFAHVGEEGTELRINPDGKMSLTPHKDTITYLEKGTKIVPHKQLMGLMRGESLKYVGGQQIDMSEVVAAIKANKPEKQRNPKVNGWIGEYRNLNNFGRYRNRHFS